MDQTSKKLRNVIRILSFGVCAESTQKYNGRFPLIQVFRAGVVQEGVDDSAYAHLVHDGEDNRLAVLQLL